MTSAHKCEKGFIHEGDANACNRCDTKDNLTLNEVVRLHNKLITRCQNYEQWSIDGQAKADAAIVILQDKADEQTIRMLIKKSR